MVAKVMYMMAIKTKREEKRVSPLMSFSLDKALLQNSTARHSRKALAQGP